MNLGGFYQEMCDFQEENEDMVRLYENYVNTDVYNEIKGFLDIYKPDWRKNRELGRSAPEFVLSIIDMWEDEEGEMTTKEWLTNIYEEIDWEYTRYKNHNLRTKNDQLLKQFENEHGSYFDGNYTKEEYDKLFDKYKLEDGEDEYWKF